MMQSKIHFGIGLFIGVLLSAFFLLFFAPRYEVFESDNNLVKQDKWSGETWVFKGNLWEKISSSTRDWKAVDQALTDALRISTKEVTQTQNHLITKMKSKYPALEDLSEEDIRERIKYIYSKKILIDLYFSNVNIK